MTKRKKIGEYIIRGQINCNTYNGSKNRIQLFDGRFDTGYQVKEFIICPKFPSVTGEFVAKLCTEPESTIAEFHWDDVRQQAWATWGVPISSRAQEFNLVPRNSLVIEDLWLSIYTTESDPSNVLCNYYILMEKYEIDAWDGAAALVENLSQAVNQQN